MNTQELRKLYDEGHTVLIANMKDGSRMTLRLFTSGDILAYYAKRKHRRGYELTERMANGIESVRTRGKQEKTPLERYTHNLRMFKKAFTQDAHPNLWGNMRDGYSRLDVDDFESYLLDNCTPAELLDSYEMYKKLCEYKRERGLDLMTENRYKTTTIKSHKPRDYMGGQYYACVENIQRHLDNKEEFSYSWQSGYDVSVSGKLCDDGFYRAWFSLEFRGCGNGHYYLLINSNQAVFAEDD